MVNCWVRSAHQRSDCCRPGAEGSLIAAAYKCWDSIFTREECCGKGSARVFPVAEAEPPAWQDAADWYHGADATSAAAQHPALSEKQRQWEVAMTNSSVMLSAEVLGQRLRLWVFKRSGPALDAAVQELRRDLYRLENLASPTQGPVSVDIGASVGMVTILLSRLWPRNRIIAVEPAPANFRYLLWNLRINGVTSQVWPLNVALGSSPSRSQVFYYSPTYPTWSQASGESESEEALRENEDDKWRGGWTDWQVRFEVEIVTLAEIFVAVGVRDVHFLKVDCEGCEWEILAPPSWPRLRHRVRNVAAELHRWALPGRTEEQNAVEDAVRRDICKHEQAGTDNEENSVCSTV